MQTSSFIIDFSTLAQGMYQYTYVLDNEFFTAQENSEVLSGQVQAQAELQVGLSGGKVLLTIKGEVAVPCDRCLDPVTIPVEGEEQLPIRIGAEGQEDAVYLDEKKQLLDLGALLNELVLLNLPIVHSHQEGECNPEMQELLRAHLTADEKE